LTRNNRILAPESVWTESKPKVPAQIIAYILKIIQILLFSLMFFDILRRYLWAKKHLSSFFATGFGEVQSEINHSKNVNSKNTGNDKKNGQETKNEQPNCNNTIQ
jgi:hypothetical protein